MQHATTEEYFSGQGIVLVAARAPNGKPLGYRPVGNVPALSIKNATSVLEHKESTTGARGTDKRLTTEIKVTMSITVENFNSKNLALAIRGTVTPVAGASVVDEQVNIFAGAITPLANIQASVLTAKMNTAPLTAYVNDQTPWDYQADLIAGSLKFNDASTTATDKLGLIPTAVTVGNTTVYTVAAGHGVQVGDTVRPVGLTGADAALGNVDQTVTAVGATSVTTSLNTTGKVLTVAAGSRLLNKTSAMPGTVSYTYATQQVVGAFADAPRELYMRFEGLNTAEDESPVVVNVFKFLLDPAQEVALLSDTLQQFVLDGSVLADVSQTGPSPYYTVTKIDKLQ